MRGLAEFVMKGRKQAIIAALLFGIFPLMNLLSPVIPGLVMLRKGPREALAIAAFAVLPLAAWAMIGDVIPLILMLGICVLALVLRETESWEFTVLLAIAVGLAVEVYMRLQPELLDVLLQNMQGYLQANAVALDGLQLSDIRAFLPSVFGAVYMFLSVLLLMLARWMQAALFNPGGFGNEMHRLRMEQKVTLVLVLLMLMADFGVLLPSSWILYLVSPLLIAGVALVHGVVALRKMSSMWLVAFYALLMMPLVLQMVVLAAIVDSWYNFRGRIQTPV